LIYELRIIDKNPIFIKEIIDLIENDMDFFPINEKFFFKED